MTRGRQILRACGTGLRRLWPKSLLGRTAVVLLGAGMVIGSLPLLLICLFLANDLAGALFGPVNIWNCPSVPPPDKEIVGDYTLNANSIRSITKLSSVRVMPSHLTLSADHAANLDGVYAYVEPFTPNAGSLLCRVTGHGLWAITGASDIQLTIRVLPTAQSVGGDACNRATWLTYAILGRSGPRRLWSYIGDPDEGDGLEYSP